MQTSKKNRGVLLGDAKSLIAPESTAAYTHQADCGLSIGGCCALLNNSINGAFMARRDRFYCVGLPDGSFRLVYTNSRRRAINHVADSILRVAVASDDDIYCADQDGIEVEHPGCQELIEFSESPAN